MSLLPRSSAAPRRPAAHAEPRFTQLAALCWRKAAGGGRDAREVLLVTSSSGRWILPKGWPIDGKTPGEAALVEAWEEGGVAKGKVARAPIGSYVAIKRTPQGDDVPCRHEVYAVKVRESSDAFPEAGRRDRRWVAPAVAANMVDEDGLRDILAKF